MKKITLWLFALFTCWQISAQTTVTIGSGTSSATGGTNGNPIYRSSAASTFNFSQSIQLLTAADLAAAGVTSGATITKIAFYKNDAFTMSAGRTATMNIYLKNSSATALTTASNFATWTTGSTNCYSNAAIGPANFPAAAGWVEYTLTTPFNYSGGAIETAIDWAINTGAGNATTGAFSWLYTTTTAIQAVGTSNSVAITGNLATSQLRQYNTQITFTTTPCTGTPTPGNTIAPSPICAGSSATLSLQNATLGSGVTYQWYMNGLAISGANSGVYVIPSVTSTNNYYCEVTCGGNTGVSSTVAVGPTLLTAPTTVETFTTYLPSCWLFGDNGDLAAGPATFGTNSWKNDGFANSGATGSIAYNHYTTGANDWIISPVINIPASGYELKFDAALTQWNGTTAPTTPWDAGDVLEVLVSTTGLDNWSVLYTIDNANPPAAAGSAIAIDLDAYASQNVRFAYRVVSGATDGADDTDIFIDNFAVRLSPTCPDQTGLVIGTVTATGASTSWDDLFTGGALGYEYAITTSATPPASGTATASTFYVASGLSPQTVYYLHVRASCAASTFGNWATTTFTTACAPVTVLPWNEGFESLVTVGATNFPSCWFKENGDWASQNTNGTYSTANTGTKYIRNSWSATNEYIWTPGFNLVAGTSYDFSSFVQGDNGTGWVVDYFVNTVQNSTGATQVGASYNVPGAGTPYAFQPYALVKRSFVPSTTGTYYFAVRVNQPSGGPWYVSFDDFKLELSPACPTPSASASNITDSSADVTWSAVPSATLGYEYVLDNVATDPAGSGTSTTSTTYSASGLTPTTVYYFHIRSVCSVGTYSAWSTISFTTLATPPVNDNCSGALVLTPGPLYTSNPVATSNVGASNSNPPAPGCAAFSGGDVWFSVVVPASGNISLETITGTITDTGLAVYSGTCAGLTLVSCDDDSALNVGSNSYISLTGRTPGEVLYVNAWDYSNNDVGTFSVTAYDASLSASTFDKSSFVAYPNPVKDVLHLSYSSVINNVRVVNLLGQEVLNTKSNANDVQVNMSGLTAGAYIVNITVEDTIHTIKVIKE